MNDKDKEAFENFWDDNYDETFPTPDKRRDSIIWQAACEYKQKEIDELISILDLKKETNIELEAENKKLRDALEEIALLENPDAENEKFWNFLYDHELILHLVSDIKIAREALKEVGEK